jgi:hypothetical protein
VTGSIVVMQYPIVCMPNSSVKMSWTAWWFTFNPLPITVTVKCRSDFTRALTLVTFSSIFDMQGLSEQNSTFIISWPSKMLYATQKPVPSIQHALHKPILRFLKFLLFFH